MDSERADSFPNDVIRDIDCAIGSDVNVLISSSDLHTSTSLAYLIHDRSTRRRGPFVVVHGSWAWDAATEEFKERICSAARTGSVFIDEVAELNWTKQTELMRLLEPDLSAPIESPDCRGLRIIAATARNLLDRVIAKTFRADLFYRLNWVHVAVPGASEPGQAWLM